MPYSMPPPASSVHRPGTPPASPPPPPTSGNGRPGHRRSYTGPGAFASLGSLPRRTPPTPVVAPSAQVPASPKKSVFHLHHDDDDDSSTDDDDDHTTRRTPYPPAVKLNPRSTLSLNLNLLRPTVHLPQSHVQKQALATTATHRENAGGTIPFPSSNVPSPTITTASPAPFSPQPMSPRIPGVRPSVARTSSSPVILLSNGKPLKSSLKSSNSSPTIAHNIHLLPPRTLHLRAASAPSTPHADLTTAAGSSDGSLSTSSSTDSLPSTPKNVHFAPKLSSIRLFHRSAKPASLLGEETETETEGTEGTECDSSAMPGYTKSGIQRRFSTAAAYPFPKFLPPNEEDSAVVTGPVPPPRYKLASAPSTSLIPAPFPSPYANVHLESIELLHVLPTDTSPSAQIPHLTMTGTLLVRNLSYAKTVAVRFTLDEWQTTSEVSARYVESLDRLPSSLFLAQSSTHQPTKPSPFNPAPTSSTILAWDRFSYTITLDNYQDRLHEKTMWMVARFAINDAKDEWWDNNSGRNYRVGFDIDAASVVGHPPKRERNRGLSAPAAPVPSMPLPSLPIKPAQPQLTIPPYVSPSQHQKHSSLNAGFHAAANRVTNERLSKLTLRNYAAPTTKVVGPTSSSPSEGVPAIVTVLTPPSPPPPPSTSSSSSSNDTPPKEDESSDDGEEDDMITPDTSPLIGTPKWDHIPSLNDDEKTPLLPLVDDDKPESPTHATLEDVKESAPTGVVGLYWPWGPTDKNNNHDTKLSPAEELQALQSPTSTTSNSTTPMSSPGLDSDSAYKAFLKQWCFARDSSPLGVAAGGIQVS